METRDHENHPVKYRSGGVHVLFDACWLPFDIWRESRLWRVVRLCSIDREAHGDEPRITLRDRGRPDRRV